MTRRTRGGLAAVGTLALLCTLAGLLPAPAAAQDEQQQIEVARLLDQAKDLGAKGQLPNGWWDLDQRFQQARGGGADAATWAVLKRDARRLVNEAAFIDEMRRRKSGMEALLGRFDQALAEIGALYGVTTDPVLTGTAAARELVAQLDSLNLHRQVLIDSLSVENRQLAEITHGQAAGQDSLITALRVENSSLRQKLWETELRAGVAEADRSAAETVLTAKQDREAAIADVKAMFTPQEADILLTAEGAVVLRVHGLDFGVGSAAVRPGQEDLIKRLARVIAEFPGEPVRIEGHTDDTGSRDANLRLSRRRAETVAGLLAEATGRDPASFTTEGFGPDKPVALNSTAEGRALNRRIDVVIGAAP